MERREPGVLGFYSSSLKHLLASRVNARLQRERSYSIGGADVVLPPAHRLPWYQSLFPSYDRYAEPLLRDLTRGSLRPLLIDVGANVGDTALLARAAVEGLRVIAIEGDPNFLAYLRRNVAAYSECIEVVDRFVTIPDRDLTYAENGSTGGFQAASGNDSPAVPTVDVAELLSTAEQHDLVIWKSDTDGLDIPILLANWEILNRECGVIWFEFDPFRDIDDGSRIPELAARLAMTNRVMHIVDNMGRSMFTVPATEAPSVLNGLSRWMECAAVPGDVSYLDVWVVEPELARRDEDSGEWVMGHLALDA